jgi:TolB-like protein/tetratricopeptide (TPR) repeat protein
MSEGAQLLSLAEGIADGAQIDWDDVEACASVDEQGTVRQLRIVANVARLHRSLPMEAGGTSPTGDAPELAAPSIGSWGHLMLVERLGGGSAGDVYRAWDPHLERDVALKLLHADEATEDPDASSLVREGRLLARVRHPNVIAVHGVAVHDGRFGLWMDLVRGATLEHHLASHGPFSAREAALIGIDLCGALAAIHGAGLIHRDVKAQNVMREDGGRIVLMDLGTGCELDARRVPAAAGLAGTPLYLAPEVFDLAPANERTDLYSLGVLLYHLVTGSFPVRAASIDELRDAHARGRRVRLRDARADLPIRFVEVVERAIARQPERRQATVGALEAELSKAIGERARSGGDGRIGHDRPAGWWKRAGVLAAAAALVLAAAFLGRPELRQRLVSTAGVGPIESIAVLPMANLSGDPLQDYFADGMTEALIGDLAKIRPLRVISRTSIMQYKGKNTPLREIADALDVDAVLEASVLRLGDRVRISANLVHVASDRHLWVDTYERDVRDVLVLQSDLARTIARAVQIQLTPQQQAGFAAAASVDPAAYDAYLQGRYYWNKRRMSDLRIGLDHFQRAVSIDPDFAPAWAGLADSYSLLIGEFTPAATYAQARAAAVKALELDPNLAEAHASLAFVKFVFDRDLAGAEEGFRQALDLNPNYATARHWYAEYLSATGRPLDAKREIEAARVLDPLSDGIRTSQGSILYMAREYDAAAAHFRAALLSQPNDAEAHYYLGLIYAQKNMLPQAVSEMRLAMERTTRSQTAMSGVGYAAALSGRTDEAADMVRQIEELTGEQWIDPTNVALVYAGLGDASSAVKWLLRAFEERSPPLMWVAADPAYDRVRTDLRFVDLMRSIGLAP